MEGHGPLTDPLSSQQQHRRKTGGSIWKRMAAAGALACLLAGVLTGCGGVVPRAKADEDRPTVTVGYDTYSPFSYVDVDGNLTGIDIELATSTASGAASPWTAGRTSTGGPGPICATTRWWR